MRILRRRGYKPGRVILTKRATHNDVGTRLHFGPTPRVASSLRTPPGPEGSKGKRALAGARGVPFTPSAQSGLKDLFASVSGL